MKTTMVIVFAIMVMACTNDEEKIIDCAPLQSEMELTQIALWNFERLNNPYAKLVQGELASEEKIKQYEQEKEIYFKAYTQAVTNFHNCKY